jgi:cytochrome c oxidase assembly protein subunit 15
VPEGYAALHPFLRNLFEGIPAVQFNHRLLATVTLLVALVTSARSAACGPGPARLAGLLLGGAVLVQYALGVATLLLVVPVGLGTAHQGMAMLVLTAALVLLHLTSRPAPEGD